MRSAYRLSRFDRVQDFRPDDRVLPWAPARRTTCGIHRRSWEPRTLPPLRQQTRAVELGRRLSLHVARSLPTRMAPAFCAESGIVLLGSLLRLRSTGTGRVGRDVVGDLISGVLDFSGGDVEQGGEGD
ncbi:hypothetical protein BHE74_00019905 [Ensete ventricosum]|nr:hypothetical protein BHE74_00019905 [Ensete ventricosum]